MRMEALAAACSRRFLRSRMSGERLKASSVIGALAGALARGEVRIVEDAGGSAFERAWRDTLDALRGFAPASTDSPGAPTA